MEDKLDKLTDALLQVQDLVKRTGKGKAGKTAGNMVKWQKNCLIDPVNVASETTIYHSALGMIDQGSQGPNLDTEVEHPNLNIDSDKRFSSSSEEFPIDTSRESGDVLTPNVQIAGQSGNREPARTSMIADPQPSTS